jgi:hypothetical protein
MNFTKDEKNGVSLYFDIINVVAKSSTYRSEALKVCIDLLLKVQKDADLHSAMFIGDIIVRLSHRIHDSEEV